MANREAAAVGRKVVQLLERPAAHLPHKPQLVALRVGRTSDDRSGVVDCARFALGAAERSQRGDGPGGAAIRGHSGYRPGYSPHNSSTAIDVVGDAHRGE